MRLRWSRYKKAMSLNAPQLRRRIEAAMVLRGLTHRQLSDRLDEEGLDRQAVRRLYREGPVLKRALHDAISRILGMPHEWFTDPRLDGIPVEPHVQLDHIEDVTDAILGILNEPPGERETKGPAGPKPRPNRQPGSTTPRRRPAMWG